VDDLAASRFDVEDLEDAADVVAVGREALADGPDDTDVAEDRLFHHVRVVRAQEEPHVDLVAEVDVLDLAGREEVPEACDGERVGAALARELDDVGALDVGDDLLRRRPLRAAELQRGEAVAVDGAVHVGRVVVERLAGDPPELAVVIDARSHELDARLEDEIARHLPPREVELVARFPHVHARRGEHVLLGGGVPGRGAGEARGADVAVALELAEAALLGDRGHGADEDEHGEDGESLDHRRFLRASWIVTGDGGAPAFR
jgi:hypothetical protein